MTGSDTPLAKLRSLAPKLHVSTYVIVGLVAVVLLLLNIPGQWIVGPDIFATGKYGPHFGVYEHCEHGWPSTYLWRQSSSPWKLLERIEQFSVAGLLADVAIALGLLFVSGLLFEAWRRRRNRFLQFHLGDLLVFTAFVAVVAGILATYRHQYRRELRALESIEKTESRTEWGIPVNERVDWQPGGPSWLRNVLGDRPFRIFDRVVGIDAADEELRHVVKLRNLKVVRLFIFSASNRQLELLQQCPHLEALDLCFAYVDDEGEEKLDDEGYLVEPCLRLPRLPSVRGINLYGAAFRGEGLEHLTSIEVLDLTDTDVDDEALSALRALTHLKDLSLAGTEVTNAGLRHLSALSQLEAVWLNDTAIDDQGLDRLANLRQLRSLGLFGNDITDASVPVLKRLTKLEYLGLDGTEVTNQGSDELRKALPDCHIR